MTLCGCRAKESSYQDFVLTVIRWALVLPGDGCSEGQKKESTTIVLCLLVQLALLGFGDGALNFKVSVKTLQIALHASDLRLLAYLAQAYKFERSKLSWLQAQRQSAARSRVASLSLV